VLGQTRLETAWASHDDPDSSEAIRRAACLWSGLPESLVPGVLSSNNINETLDVSARLAYCPKCWHQDVERGSAPYMRKAWTNWSCVICSTHRDWLSAREPYGGFGSELTGWAPIWKTEPAWARAAHVVPDPGFSAYALGFGPSAISVPDCPWNELENELTQVAAQGEILACASKSEFYGVRQRIWDAIASDVPTPRISDGHLRGYRRDRPGWITARIACLVFIAESRRLAAGRAPAFIRARSALLANTVSVSEFLSLQPAAEPH
jgi:hypothetical protein